MPAWFERNHLPLGLYAAPAAVFGVTPLALKMPEQEAAALPLMDDDRPEPTADMGVNRPNPLAASSVHSRKCAIHPLR